MTAVPESLSSLQVPLAGGPPAIPSTEAVQKGVALGRSGLSAVGEHPKLGLALVAIVSLAVLAITLAGVLYWLRERRQRLSGSASTTAVSSLGGLHKDRLRTTWNAFVRQLPASLRATLTEYGQFLVLGASGSGKSTLIGQMTDWQGQSHLFLPSLVSDPLLQIYLGQKLIVQELSAALLQSTTQEVSEMLRRLLRAQPSSRPLVVIIVVSSGQLADVAPDRIRRDAQLVAGKLGLLAEERSSRVLLRVCVTGMDQILGYPELARFVQGEQRVVAVPLSAQSIGQGSELFSQVEPLLSKLLLTQPVATFDKVISFLQKAPQRLRPVLDFVSALREASGGSRSIELDRLFFASLRSDEQIGNPFLLPQRGLRGLRTQRNRWIDRIPFSIHGVLAVLGAIVIAGAGSLLLLRHYGQIRRADQQLQELSQRLLVRHSPAAAQARLPQTESLHRALVQMKEQLNDIQGAEQRLTPLRWAFQDDKERLRSGLADSLRSAYLLPALNRAIELRSQKLVLAALAAIYASQHGSLGGVLRGQLAEYSQKLAIPENVLRDYLQVQERAYGQQVLTTLPALRAGVAEEQRSIISSPQPLRNWLHNLTGLLARPALSRQDLATLREQTDRIRAALTQLARERQQEVLFQLLEEESPLDMRRLFGPSVQVLVPEPHLAENQEPCLALTQLLMESTDGLVRGDKTNLLVLLRWVNKERPKLDGHRDLFVVNLEGERIEIETQKWLDLLLRTRKHDLLGTRPERSSRGRKHHSKRSNAQSLSHTTVASPLAKVISEKAVDDAESTPLLHRAHFEEQVAPLLRELDRALAQAGPLSEAEKLSLARLVRDEVRRYAGKYCQSQTAYFLSHLSSAKTPAQPKADLLALLRDDSSLLKRIRTVVDNTRLPAIEHPLLQPLRECLAIFAPLAPLLVPGKDGTLTALAPYRAAAAELAKALSGPSSTAPDEGKPDTQTAAPAIGQAILSRLSPLAKTALALRNPATPHRQQVEQFLDNAGIPLQLRKPFLRPFEAVYWIGKAEVEQVAVQLFQQDIEPPLLDLLRRFPFAKTAKQEASISEIERLLHPQNGQLWKNLQTTYGGLLEERAGLLHAASTVDGNLPAPRLPAELWQVIRKAEHLRALLFQSDGSAKPLRLLVRPLPIPLPRMAKGPQPTLSFLRVGGSEVIGMNQQPSSKPLLLDWKNQGVATVGLEYTAPDSNRKQVQSIEVSDSAWSFHRLLNRAAISEPQATYFQLIRESETSRWSLGFSFDPDPFALFHIPTGKREK